MNDLIDWLEAHEKLAGWAQFAGAIAALAVTYLTVFIPIWRRKRQLRRAGTRLLSHGYEALESYHRSLTFFSPFAISLRGAAVSMSVVVEELGRFPAYELDDQGSHSLARRIVAMSGLLNGMKLFLETTAAQMGDEQAAPDDHIFIRDFVADQMNLAHAMITNKVLKRPEWPRESGQTVASVE
ncbi:MAG: hypothetical protein JHD35_09670 [Sphingopyxis sp.]|nr:hypothetical protein [Sphingopyxis sp.]